MTTTALTTARAAYANAVRGLTYDNASRDAVKAEIRSMVSDNATPAQWVVAAESCRMPCRLCHGTGAFITETVNGMPRGPGGQCYRCGGYGTQTATDGHRNRGADRYQIVAAARAMMGMRPAPSMDGYAYDA